MGFFIFFLLFVIFYELKVVRDKLSVSFIFFSSVDLKKQFKVSSNGCISPGTIVWLNWRSKDSLMAPASIVSHYLQGCRVLGNFNHLVKLTAFCSAKTSDSLIKVFRKSIKMSKISLNPRESGAYIIENAKHVRVLPAGIEKLSQEILKALKEKRLSVENFSQHELHPNPDPNQAEDYTKAADWVFVLDTLNFCFWTPSEYIVANSTNIPYP